MLRIKSGLAVVMGALSAAPAAFAQHATNGAISLTAAKSPIAEEVHVFHNWILMPIMVGISLFVLALLGWVIFKYNAKANPNPARFSHNTVIEVIWTGAPILILLFIALFSFDLLYKEDVTPDGKQFVFEGDGSTSSFEIANDFNKGRKVVVRDHLDVYVANGDGAVKQLRKAYSVEGTTNIIQRLFGGKPADQLTVTLAEAPSAGDVVMVRAGRSRVGRTPVFGVFGANTSEIALAPTVTIKAVGLQWAWKYYYPDFGEFEIISNMLKEEETTKELYRLAVDYPIYVPVGETIRIVTAAEDVIHSWAMPNFAIKVDAVPGRLNETWFSVREEGTYYGQCSEICGIKHAFMPIEVRAVSRPDFMAWVNEQREFNGLEPITEPMAAGPAAAGPVQTALKAPAQ
ncbi:MAG: cytochrome c oxidase subunit II transmembrane domain-containing protein [Pseudomonadota bacterium]